MNKFEWYNATSVKEALDKVNATVSEALQANGPSDASVFKAGGTDLMDLLKEGLISPKQIVNLRTIPGLDTIGYDKKSGLRIGANVTLAQILRDGSVKENYKALYQAVKRLERLRFGIWEHWAVIWPKGPGAGTSAPKIILVFEREEIHALPGPVKMNTMPL